MSESDQSVARSSGEHDDLLERFWALDELSIPKGGSTIDVTTGLASLRFVWSALRRHGGLLIALTLLGLLVGTGLYVKFPPARHATTTVLLIDSPNQDPALEVQTDVALATSTTVGQNVVNELGLQTTAGGLLATYNVVAMTDQVLLISLSAPTSDEAVQRAAAVAKQFLAFRAKYTQTQFAQQADQLNSEVTQAKQKLASINSQIAQTTDPTKLAALQDQQKAASNSLAQIQQYVTGNIATLESAEANMNSGSEVLNAAVAQKPSKTKGAPLYVGGGLLGGLALGIIIVAIGALTSDRLRRRSDIAYTLRAPVRLSVGPLRARRLPSLGRAAKARRRDMRRVVDYLDNAIPGASRGPAGLAIAAVDDPKTAAEVVVSLALENAGKGKRVMLADLSADGLAARRLGVKDPGINRVEKDGRPIVLVMPDPDSVVPVGPLSSHASAAGYAQADERLAAEAGSTDLVLTLVTLDPVVGSEHLATWATSAVAIVTTGRSSTARINATAEMIRLAGIRLDSVVLVDSDRDDDSLGVFEADFPAHV